MRRAFAETDLEALFETPVSLCQAVAGDRLSPLAPGEASAVGPRWVEKRRLEYQAGRHCARTALSNLGVTAHDLVADADGCPIWPEGVAGSITHTGALEGHFAAAVVTRDAASIGIDAELDEPLASGLLPRIMSPEEIRRQGFDPSDGSEELRRLGTLFFSLKESVYKSQYPISRQFLGFHEVEATVDLKSSSFEARLLRDAGPLPKGTPFRGRLHVSGGLVVTGTQLEKLAR